MNLLKNLDNFLLYKVSDSIAGKEKSQMSPDKYFRKIAERMDKISQKPSEWMYEFEAKLPHGDAVLTLDQKQSLMEYTKTISFQEFSWFMGLLCRMLDYLDQNDELTSPIGKMLMKNHTFLKTEVLPLLYPQQNNQFDKQIQRLKQDQQKKPKCPKCGSDKLISNGLSWYCKNCHKQTRKTLV